MVTEQDRAHLRRALELALRGAGRVSPNPLVGAVVVRDGKVIGEGFHAELGGPHAERAALAACREHGEDPGGSTLYLTLEPCAHSGRQPPCVEAILEAGVGRVVIAAEDPSAKASGRGPAALRDAGVEVVCVTGSEAAEAVLQNQPFRKLSRTGRPHVVFKAAASLDGRTAAAGGEARWISGEDSRALVHRWRGEADAIAVGIGTVLADDPLLTARDGAGSPQPHRVVFDSRGRLPADSQLLASVAESPVIVVASAAAPGERLRALTDAGAETIVCRGDPPRRAIEALEGLGRRGLASVMLEGGATLAGSFLAAGEIDELRLFFAPLVLGGGAPPVLGGGGAESIVEAVRPLSTEWSRCGEDMLVRARIREW